MRKTDAMQNSVNRIGNFFKMKMPRTVGLLDMGLAKLSSGDYVTQKVSLWIWDFAEEIAEILELKSLNIYIVQETWFRRKPVTIIEWKAA